MTLAASCFFVFLQPHPTYTLPNIGIGVGEINELLIVWTNQLLPMREAISCRKTQDLEDLQVDLL